MAPNEIRGCKGAVITNPERVEYHSSLFNPFRVGVNVAAYSPEWPFGAIHIQPLSRFLISCSAQSETGGPGPRNCLAIGAIEQEAGTEMLRYRLTD